jgi:ribonuclease M5
MVKIKEAILVEGRYDKNTLSQIVDAPILETSGFGIFKDKEKQKLLRRLADEKGIIVLTDSDSAGFLIRKFLKSSIPEDKITHVYIPDVYGKEKRKTKQPH